MRRVSGIKEGESFLNYPWYKRWSFCSRIKMPYGYNMDLVIYFILFSLKCRLDRPDISDPCNPLNYQPSRFYWFSFKFLLWRGIFVLSFKLPVWYKWKKDKVYKNEMLSKLDRITDILEEA